LLLNVRFIVEPNAAGGGKQITAATRQRLVASPKIEAISIIVEFYLAQPAKQILAR
jgi:hypothetical protein